MIEMNSSEFHSRHSSGSMFDAALKTLQTQPEPEVGKVLAEECPEGVRYQAVRQFLLNRKLLKKGYKPASKDGKVYMVRYNPTDPKFAEEAK